MAAARRKPSSQQQLLGRITGYWISQLVFVAAKLGIADQLAKGPLTAEVLAKRVGANGPYLRRTLRALASVGVFAEDPDGRFRLTPLAQNLRSNRPGSLRDFALMMVDDYHWQAWGALEYGINSGACAFEHVHGVPTFAYLQQHPEKGRQFSASMASISGGENAAITRAYPFGGLSTLVDIGGAHGHLLATILRRHRKLKGVLYDMPQVVTGAARSGFVTAQDVRDRCRIEGGDFFKSVPAGADGYIMKYIMHDWDDEHCVRILNHCRTAMTPGGSVLVVDCVIPRGNGPYWGKLLDVNMMVGLHGKERTREEFRDLFAGAGLRLKRVVPTNSPLSVLEAVRA